MSIIRWQPEIEHWQHILELEIAEQQKTSQVELLNTFQFGNTLTIDLQQRDRAGDRWLRVARAISNILTNCG